MAIPTLAFIGILISLIIFLYNHRNIYLAVFYSLTSLNGFFLYLIFLSDHPTLAAIFVIHSFPLFLLIGPVLWFYVRGEITGELRIQRMDFWHFVPFLLNVIQIIPYALKPWSYKLVVASYLKTINTVGMQDLHLPWISFRAYFSVRILIFFIYLIYCIRYFIKNLTNPILIKVTWKIKWLKWFLSLNLIANLFINLLTISGIIYSKASYPGTLGIIVSSFFGTFLFISTFLFPKILYGNLIKNAPIANNLNTPSESEIADFANILQKYIDEHQYIQVSFSKSKILADSRVSNRLFTYYFNEHLQYSFTQWRNKHRLDYSMKLISDGYLKNHTIESLAKKVGFQSRNSFATSFKAQFGSSPSEKIGLN
jgi:AraC-like DNA-binding protein